MDVTESKKKMVVLLEPLYDDVSMKRPSTSTRSEKTKQLKTDTDKKMEVIPEDEEAHFGGPTKDSSPPIPNKKKATIAKGKRKRISTSPASKTAALRQLRRMDGKAKENVDDKPKVKRRVKKVATQNLKNNKSKVADKQVVKVVSTKAKKKPLMAVGTMRTRNQLKMMQENS